MTDPIKQALVNALMGAFAAQGGIPPYQGKPIDYRHVLPEGEPIKPCCGKMQTMIVIRHDCNCPGKIHQGAILHCPDCQCPDRFIYMADNSKPPEIEMDLSDHEYDEVKIHIGDKVEISLEHVGQIDLSAGVVHKPDEPSVN